MLEPDDEVRIIMKDADIVTPRGECIVSNMSFSVTAGHGLMVTGRGGTGKTSFARVMAGLWDAHGGSLERPQYQQLARLRCHTAIPWSAVLLRHHQRSARLLHE